MPITAARFSLTIDGYEIASFSELAGISSGAGSVDFIQTRDNEMLLLNRVTAVRAQTALTFIRPRSTDPRLFAWHL